MIKKVFSKFVLGAGVVNLVALLVLLNFGARITGLQLDLTKNRIHSLSESSKKIIKELEDIVVIKIFASEDLPPEFGEKKRNLEQIVNQMKRAGGNKLRIEYVDVKSEEGMRELEENGIPPLQFSTLNSDKFEVSSGYFGMAVVLGEKKEVFPLISDLSNVEYYLLTSIKKLSSETIPMVGINTDHGEALEEINLLGRVLSSSYELVPVEVSSEMGIGEGLDLLLFVGPTEEFLEEDVLKIKTFAENGGSLLFLIDSVGISSGLVGEEYESGLEDLFLEWGMEMEKGLVADAGSPSLANFMSNNGPLLLSYPYWVGINSSGLAKDSPISSSLENLVIPWGSSIKVGENVKSLVWSSDKSFLVEDYSNLIPDKDFSVPEDASSLVMAVIRTEGVKVGLVGDSDFVKDSFSQNNQQNLVFALNFVDYLSAEDGLFDIRAKDIRVSGIRPVEEKESKLIKSINLAAPIVILLAIYLVSFQIRKRTNRLYKGEDN